MWTSVFIFFADVCSVKTFFGIPPWYKYLVGSGRMAANKVTGACELVGKLQWGDLTLVALAVLDMALRISGLVAAVFVLYAGFQYVTSDGQPEKTADAQKTIINALIGMAIALVAAAVVSFIGNKLG
jgi:hypothetical protein